MSVTILSKRLFKIDQKESLIPLFKELRDLAKKQNGFISRGTFSSLTDPGEYIVISEWIRMRPGRSREKLIRYSAKKPFSTFIYQKNFKKLNPLSLIPFVIYKF